MMVFENAYTIEMNKEYGEDLIKLDFNPRLLCSPKDCEIWYNHCTKYDMKFLKGSYGSLVHKDFDKYFRVVENPKIYDEITEGMFKEIPNVFLDHKNLIQSRFDETVYILTTSPYHIFHNQDINILQECGLDTYVINPRLLDYYVFMNPVKPHPLVEMNYAFTNASEKQMRKINKGLKDIVGLYGFELLVKGNGGI